MYQERYSEKIRVKIIYFLFFRGVKGDGDRFDKKYFFAYRVKN